MSLNCFSFFLFTLLYITNLTVIPAIPLYKGIRSSCRFNDHSGQVNSTRCFPVLAAWIYSAYSRTALHRAIAKFPQYLTSVEMPVLPDASETCVDSFGKALENRGIQLMKINETCDVVYCYCGIRLHPLSCPEAFMVNSGGEIVLAVTDMLVLSDSRLENTSITNYRSSKLRGRGCQMMGLTWLLNKNTSGYIQAVSDVLRALMLSEEDKDQSSTTVLQASILCYLLPFVLAYINFIALFSNYYCS
ncbi:unnamed protein product [Withania somnifera]